MQILFNIQVTFYKLRCCGVFSLECEQELLNGMETDKINSHIEDLCIKKAPLTKLLRLFLIQCKSISFESPAFFK